MIREQGYRARSKPRVGRGSRGTSWTSVILRSLATFVIILALSAVVGYVLGTILAILGMAGNVEWSVISGLVGVSLTLLLAFFLGATSPGAQRAASGLSTAYWWSC
jgi:hypothetical protein